MLKVIYQIHQIIYIHSFPQLYYSNVFHIVLELLGLDYNVEKELQPKQTHILRIIQFIIELEGQAS